MSRSSRPSYPSASVNAGVAYNIIPETCFFRGTIRTYSKKLRRDMPRMIRRVVNGVCKAHGAEFEMEYLAGYDAVVNDARAVDRVNEIAADLFGRKCLATSAPRWERRISPST